MGLQVSLGAGPSGLPWLGLVYAVMWTLLSLGLVYIVVLYVSSSFKPIFSLYTPMGSCVQHFTKACGNSENKAPISNLVIVLELFGTGVDG